MQQSSIINNLLFNQGQVTKSRLGGNETIFFFLFLHLVSDCKSRQTKISECLVCVCVSDRAAPWGHWGAVLLRIHLGWHSNLGVCGIHRGEWLSASQPQGQPFCVTEGLHDIRRKLRCISVSDCLLKWFEICFTIEPQQMFFFSSLLSLFFACIFSNRWVCGLI